MVFDKLYESLMELLLEAGYGDALPKSSFTFTKKALKCMKKNPMLEMAVRKSKGIQVQKLNASTQYGDWSFRIDQDTRGFGTSNDDNTYIVNWVGPHHVYNQILK
jgi:hypothetical protein